MMYSAHTIQLAHRVLEQECPSPFAMAAAQRVLTGKAIDLADAHALGVRIDLDADAGLIERIHPEQLALAKRILGEPQAWSLHAVAGARAYLAEARRRKWIE
jgi:enoyl-CoA hydratase/carnithine racemase